MGFTPFGSIRKEHFDKWKKHYLMWFVNGLEKTAEGFALKLTSEIDWCALLWILNCSDKDKELELFFASIPDSSRLKAVNNITNTSSGKPLIYFSMLFMLFPAFLSKKSTLFEKY